MDVSKINSLVELYFKKVEQIDKKKPSKVIFPIFWQLDAGIAYCRRENRIPRQKLQNVTTGNV